MADAIIREPTQNPSKGCDGFTFGRFALLLGALVLLLFPDVLFGRRTFFYRDFELFAYPWAHFFRECVWRGELPLWNPLNNCGIPFLAQWNTMTLYPPSLFYLVLPLSWALGVFCLFHLYLGGLGMYRLALEWSTDRWASCVAGLAYAFSGLMLSSLMWSNTGAALGWMPWVVWLVPRAWREGRWIAAVIVASLQMLAGSPEVTLLTWLLLLVLWSVDAVRGSAPWATMARRAAVVVLFVAGICAVQLLPFLELLAHSHRSAEFAEATIWPMPLWGGANFLVPLFFTFPWTQNVFFQYDQYWVCSYYVGIGTVLLAGVALWKVRGPQVIALGCVLAFSLVMAMGPSAFLYEWLMNLLPGLGMVRYPIKFVVLAVFTLPLLAAMAAARFSPGSSRETRIVASDRRGLIAGAAILLGAIGIIVWFARFHPRYSGEFNQWAATWKSGWTRAVLLVLFAGGVAALTRVRREKMQGVIRLALLALIWLDAATHAPNPAPTHERWAYEPIDASALPVPSGPRVLTSAAAEQALHESKGENSEEAYLRKRLGLYANCNLLDGIHKVNGVYSLHLLRTEQIVELLYGDAPPQHRAGLERFLAVSAVTSPANPIEWVARTNFLPFVSSGQLPVFASDIDTLAGLASEDFDPARTVYLPLEARELVVVKEAALAHIAVETQTSHRIVARVEASEPSLAVLSQSWYPAWKAYLDGQPVDLWRANHAFQAVAVPAGEHELVLAYEDRSFRLGGLISLFTLLGAGVTLHRTRRKRKRQPHKIASFTPAPELTTA